MLFMHNANSPDVMPCVVTHAANPNDIMHCLCNTCVLVSWTSLCNYHALKSTYWHGVLACSLTTTTISHLTFLGTNYQKYK